MIRKAIAFMTLAACLSMTGLAIAQYHISGKITDAETGEALPGANVYVEDTMTGTVSSGDGIYRLTLKSPGNYTLVVRFLGYVSINKTVSIQNRETEINFALEPTTLRGQDVVITATRAVPGRSPVAFATLTNEDLQQRYFAQDIPVLLSELPSTTFYSESGTGIGYNYLSIRGFDQRRISVMINGIPQNDPEDHNVYWVDFPDFLGNVEDIQVQRGAGNAFYGPPAIGGSINIITTRFEPERKISLYTGFGNYGTRKLSVGFNSGLLANQFIVYGRLSQIKSDGYREQSWVDFRSYFVGAARFGKRSVLRLHFYGGPIEDHLAYYGISKQAAKDRNLRKQNPIQRPDEIENFNQPHLELFHRYQIKPNLILNNTLFGIRGYGFFDYDGSWAPFSYYRLTPEYGFQVKGNPEELYPASLLIRAYVDNKQAGWLPSLEYRFPKGKAVVGGEFRIHRSLHWGRIQKATGDLPVAVAGEYSGLNYIGKRRYYEYNGAKDILSPYLHTTYHPADRLSLLFDLQAAFKRYRLYNEKFLGNEFTLSYFFLNPRFGLHYVLSPADYIFFSVARTSREPRLKTYYDAAEASTPVSWGAVLPQFEQLPDGRYDFTKPLVKPETLYDFELGFGHRGSRFQTEINIFSMQFRDEIIKKGQLDRFGQPITGNAEQTSHNGIEVTASTQIIPNLNLAGNLSFSRNQLRRYRVYDNDGTEHVLDGNPIAGFPDFLGNLQLLYEHRLFYATITMQHVGKQYTDNFKNEENTVDPYTVFHASLGLRLEPLFHLSGGVLQFHVRNLFDTLYITHGSGDEFFPAAERQYFVNLKLER